MRFITKILPSWKNAHLAILAAVLLILSFPDFEYWFLAWFALVPLMWAVEREKASIVRSFVVGWLFGTVFFFGTCWWLTFAPITYAGFPWPLAYFLMLCVSVAVGLFPALFAGILAVLLRRFGSGAFLAAPLVWVFTEFLRYWLTGNNWNALAYSQALNSMYEPSLSSLISFEAFFLARFGGVPLVSFIGMIPNTLIAAVLILRNRTTIVIASATIVLSVVVFFLSAITAFSPSDGRKDSGLVVAIQPNIPMSGLDQIKLESLRDSQTRRAEVKIAEVRNQKDYLVEGQFKFRIMDTTVPTLVILPESPMNFMYEDDQEFQKFINDFARRNNVSVLFNSAEPDATNGKYFNSAVMVSPQGVEAAQYDKIYLLPFGEAVPPPLEGILPGFVGNFSYGREYDLLPLGDAKAGVMICFESHFGQLSREYVRRGADVIIEMTNDGYLGPTPVLRQHLANAVFRAVETNRPVLRVTNVGITAYINEKGAVLDPTTAYQEDTRVWSVSKSDGHQTFYVKYGDWFAWLCSFVTIGMLMFALATRRQTPRPQRSLR